MGSSPIALREERRHTSGMDRHSEGSCSGPEEITAVGCAPVAGADDVLSATPLAEEAQTATQVIAPGVGLHELWFALSRQQRAQFGGHFSEMLLRAVRRHWSSK